jgi:hypothetical protein
MWKWDRLIGQFVLGAFVGELIGVAYVSATAEGGEGDQ